jgi:mannosyltransferase OCH1-like enzyme
MLSRDQQLLLVCVLCVVLIITGTLGTLWYQNEKTPAIPVAIAAVAPVPKRIWQTWHTTELPKKMQEATEIVKKAHPEFEYNLVDDEGCLNYITRHFKPEVADAYRRIVPGAYKADLWRLCVMYIDGGIYLDIKFVPVAPFTFHQLLNGTQFVRDRGKYLQPGIYNAFLVCYPGDSRIKACIDRIVHNVATEFYGKTWLEPTGPALLAKYIHPRGADVTMKLTASLLRNDNRTIRSLKGEPLVQCYKGYTAEQNRHSKTPRYAILWTQKAIYTKK